VMGASMGGVISQIIEGAPRRPGALTHPRLHGVSSAPLAARVARRVGRPRPDRGHGVLRAPQRPLALRCPFVPPPPALHRSCGRLYNASPARSAQVDAILDADESLRAAPRRCPR
jgi:hypothetical protein